MPGDPLFPIAASLLVKDIGPPAKRLPLVAFASVIEGPLGIAPALLALQRARNAGEVGEGRGAKRRVHRPLVAVPDVVGRPLTAPDVAGQPNAGALETLKRLKLGYDIDLYESDDATKDHVQAQDPAPPDLVEEGTTVTLKVGAGPAEGTDGDAPESSIERTNELLEHMDKTLTALNDKLAAAAPPAPAAQAAAAPADPATPAPPTPTGGKP
jgi:hypothetical protein